MMARVAAYLCEKRNHQRLLAFQRLHESTIIIEQQPGDARPGISLDAALEQFLQIGRAERLDSSARINDLIQGLHNPMYVIF